MKGLAINGLRKARLPLVALGTALVLQGCISLGKDPPPSLLTLSPVASVPVGTSASGSTSQILAVMVPGAPQKLDVTRVPVQVDDATLAYLKDAVWVEKPARLFGRLLVETIRAQQKRMVIEGSDSSFAPTTRLSGQLVEMGYDAPTQSAVVRFDGVIRQEDGTILSRRFEARVPGVLPEAREVGHALNEAANRVAAEVAEWVG